MRRNITSWVWVLLATMELLIAFSMPASALQASFTASKTQGQAPLTVSFGPSVSGGIQPYHYNWVFGDGQVSSEMAPTHTYTAPGTYSVTLTVTCSCQPPTSVYYSQTITVGGSSLPLSSSFSANPADGTAPLNVSLTQTISGGIPPYTYHWDFGDGNLSEEVNPTHLFEAPGAYTVVLTVSSSDPNSVASSSHTVVVRSPPRVRVAAEAGIGNASLQVNFSSLVNVRGSDYSYLWDFGDGVTSTEAIASHTYGAPGTYSIELKVTDTGSGETVSERLKVQVDIPTHEVAKDYMLALGLIVPLMLGIVVLGLWLNKRRSKD